MTHNGPAGEGEAEERVGTHGHGTDQVRQNRPARTPIEARQAERAAMARALGAGLTATELKVFLALVMLVTNYDRTVDRVPNRQVANLTGIDPRHVRRALQSLAAKGVLIRDPGSPGRASTVAFPAPTRGAEPAPTRGAEPAPTRGAEPAPAMGAGLDIYGGVHAPASEVLPEEGKGGRGAEPAPLDLEQVAMPLVRTHPGEVPSIVAQLTDAHGRQAVADALAALAPQNGGPAPYQWPSNLRNAIAAEIRKSRRSSPASAPKSYKPTGPEHCARCEGTGQAEDELGRVLPRCPTCGMNHAEARLARVAS